MPPASSPSSSSSASRRSAVSERAARIRSVSVERAFEIVAMLADLDEGASLADIARHLDVNKAIAVKLLTTLEGLGNRCGVMTWRKRYNLTYRISNLRSAASCRKHGCSISRPPCLKALAEETRPNWCVLPWSRTATGLPGSSGLRRQRSLQIDPNYSLDAYLHNDSDRQILACHAAVRDRR